MRTSIFGLMAAPIAILVSAPAYAQDADIQEPGESSISVSANVALTSDYRFRGISFSDGDFAVQGGIDIAHDSGLYVGTWASSIEDSPTFGHTELDLYGGWSGEISSGINADIGLLYYVYPNGEGGAAGPSDYFEPYASISGTLGPAELKLGAAYAFDGQSALGNEDNLYVYTDLGIGVPNTPITLNAHLGYTDGILSPDIDPVTLRQSGAFDYSFGADYAITSNLTASATFVGVEGPSVDGISDDTVVFTISASF
ncbi:TorF family putative porin [Sphingorhabdus sp. Alg239-R122]|uniref:TorF family putative porin n=1 Tax=Sphingorhabdus sp. Alg239-R122 TaxID=2305989 RepID=UPI0013D9A609|nr:TorF family putative porin [Sphingorhabdus sp. Alg239-R122]